MLKTWKLDSEFLFDQDILVYKFILVLIGRLLTWLFRKYIFKES